MGLRNFPLCCAAHSVSLICGTFCQTMGVLEKVCINGNLVARRVLHALVEVGWSPEGDARKTTDTNYRFLWSTVAKTLVPFLARHSGFISCFLNDIVSLLLLPVFVFYRFIFWGQMATLRGQQLLALSSDFTETADNFLRLTTSLVSVSTALRRSDKCRELPVEFLLNDALVELEPCWNALDEWLSLLSDAPCELEETMCVAVSSTLACEQLRTNIASSNVVPSDGTLFALYLERLAVLLQGMYMCSKAGSRDPWLLAPAFVSLMERHDGIIRRMLQTMPTLMFKHFYFLLDHQCLQVKFRSLVRSQPFTLRRQWFFDNLLRTDVHSMADMVRDVPVWTVKRNQLFESSCGVFGTLHPEDLRENFAVQFEGEPGMGAGVKREWFSILSREMLNPNYGLFVPSLDQSAFQPNPNSFVNADHLVILTNLILLVKASY